jgi:hypothetical protein
VILIGALWACGSANDQNEPLQPTVVEQTAVPPLSTGDNNMSEGTSAGSMPEQLDIRLQRRDTSPLPPDALLKFQVISRGKSPAYNYRWLLYTDGRWFLAWHSGDTSDWQTPFDTELPATPTKQLKANVVNEVKKQLQQADFLTQPPYQADQTVEGGSAYVVTAQIDGKVHEVIYDGDYPPLIEFLETIVTTYQ